MSFFKGFGNKTQDPLWIRIIFLCPFCFESAQLLEVNILGTFKDALSTFLS